MFKRLYEAGKSLAENKLERFVWSKTMKPAEKKDASGMLGIAAGGVLQNVAYYGMAIAALVAIGIGMAPGGLTVAAFLALGATGTALAGVGVFGKGMQDGGDGICGGVIAQAREMRKSLYKGLWNDLRGVKPQTPVLAPDAKPAAEDFAAAVAGMTAKPAAFVPAPVSAPTPVSMPENK
jgi:hypothetical protein